MEKMSFCSVRWFWIKPLLEGNMQIRKKTFWIIIAAAAAAAAAGAAAAAAAAAVILTILESRKTKNKHENEK